MCLSAQRNVYTVLSNTIDNCVGGKKAPGAIWEMSKLSGNTEQSFESTKQIIFFWAFNLRAFSPLFCRQVYNRFGVVTSFTGTYRADQWSLVLSSPDEQTSPPFHGNKPQL